MLSSSLWAASETKLPNIVWIMAEDIGTDLASYGTPGVQTPNLDQMAANGLRLNRLYCTSPICSTNRTAMMTGMYQTSINGHHHRSHRVTPYALPDGIMPITTYLAEQGYYLALGCGYQNKTDLNFDQSSIEWDGDDWSGRAEGQPFYAHIQLRVTHRGDWWEEVRANSPDPVSVDEIELPPYLPDHPEIRKDWAMYLDQIEKADEEVGEIIQRLKDEGILENTLLIFIGDNGRCVHRGKGFLYEDGIRVPGIIHWPGRVEPGMVSDELVSTIDISAQVLAAAGVEIPEYMQGRAFLEEGPSERDFVYAARDRWDEVYDKSRAIIGHRFKYIRNDMPEVPVFTYQEYLEMVRPIRPILWDLYQAGEMDETQAYYMAPEKPREEIFDLVKDPWETRNLAENPRYAWVLDSMRRFLTQWEEQTNDMGRLEESFDSLDERTQNRIRLRNEKLASGDAVQ